MLAATYFLARAQSDDQYTTSSVARCRPPNVLAKRHYWVGATDAAWPRAARGWAYRSVSASPTFTVSPRTHGALGRLTWCVPGCQSMLEPCHTLSKLCLEPSAVGLTKFSQVGKLQHQPLQATVCRPSLDVWPLASATSRPARQAWRCSRRPRQASANVMSHCYAAARHALRRLVWRGIF